MDRVKRAQHLLISEGLDMYVSYDPIEIKYIFDVEVSTGCLLITPEKAQIFVDSRYIEALKKVKGLSVELGKPNLKGKVGFDGSRTTYDQAMHIKKTGATLKNMALISKIRQIKDSSELKKIEHVANLVQEAMVYAVNNLCVGMQEVELKEKLENFYQSAGAECSFEIIVAFGKNTAFIHHHSTQKTLALGDLVMIDMGAKFNGYCSDMTRTFLYKKKNSKIEKMYEKVVLAHDAAASILKPSVEIGEADKQARVSLGELEKYFTHSLGHGIGIEVHEEPFLKKGNKETFHPSMVVTIEPGVYDPLWGGIRYENMFAVNENGAQNLTPLALPFIID